MKYTGSSDFQLREEAVLKRMCQMKTGKWFIKLVLPVTIFVEFGGILTALQPESTVCYCFCAQDEQD
jgi:hypothetical protein